MISPISSPAPAAVSAIPRADARALAQKTANSANASPRTDTVTLSPAGTALAGSSVTGRYDFTQMTPATMKGVAHQLFRSGQIDLEQSLTLQSMGVPLGKAGPNGEFIPLTDEERTAYENTPVNYLETTQSSIQFLEQTGYAADPLSGYAQLKNLLVTLSSQQKA